MAHVRTYRPNVRVGNWREDVTLEEDTLKDFLERKERGELMVQKTGFLKQNILKQLYLTSDHKTFQKCAKKSRLQEVIMEHQANFLSWWKVLHHDPQERLEHEGLPVPANSKVLISHCKTNQALAVVGQHILWTPYGKEYQVTAVVVLTYCSSSNIVYSCRTLYGK
eukprot:XP_014025922.1 PREDICTED: uncharacterized protein C15orf26 homolog isoform X2 [Salmo salar]